MVAQASAVPVDDPPAGDAQPRLGFVASTGRTATMFLAATLDSLRGVTAYHEGHTVGPPRSAQLPLINVQNRQAWHDVAVARQTVAGRRGRTTIVTSAVEADLIVDIAFYNAALLPTLVDEHPTAAVVVIFRRCESFVRSATFTAGEDPQPAGWPDPSKRLTDRERFIELGRLRPAPGTPDAHDWPSWSGIQRNIWLWHTVNSQLSTMLDDVPGAVALRYEDLVDEPRRFWSQCLHGLGLDRHRDLDICVARSSRPMNARSNYHVGPLGSWDQAERDMYHQLAVPLEERLYDHG